MRNLSVALLKLEKRGEMVAGENQRTIYVIADEGMGNWCLPPSNLRIGYFTFTL